MSPTRDVPNAGSAPARKTTAEMRKCPIAGAGQRRYLMVLKAGISMVPMRDERQERMILCAGPSELGVY